MSINIKTGPMHHAELFGKPVLFTNWLNYYVYQETPFRIEDISKLGDL